MRVWACACEAHLSTHRYSRRSERSSKPSCEAGTHPCDGKDRALSSARPQVTGPLSAKTSGKGRECLTFARTFFPRPAQADEVYSAHKARHDDMRALHCQVPDSKSALTFQICRRH
jgi:hypothetical protein